MPSRAGALLLDPHRQLAQGSARDVAVVRTVKAAELLLVLTWPFRESSPPSPDLERTPPPSYFHHHITITCTATIIIAVIFAPITTTTATIHLTITLTTASATSS